MRIINHSSFVTFHQKDNTFFDRFLGCRTLKDIRKFILAEADKYEELYMNAFESSDKVKGDIFEIFAEIFMILLEASPQLGIYNYIPVNAADDNGVDGTGIGMDGKPATVQVKFRSNTSIELTSDDIKQFPFQSIMKYNVDQYTTKNMIVFTNTKGLHWYTDSDVFLDRLRVISGNTISQNIDNNLCFWEVARNLVKDSINYKFGEKNNK